MDNLKYYTEAINEHMDVFMIPRLINNLEESTKSQVIWINDAVNIEHYKHIDKVLFLGLHPVNKNPYLLNYAASDKNMDLNFEIMTVWGFLKDWIYREKIQLDSNSTNDKISGNYILQFNKAYELIYINDYDKQEMESFFTFPTKLKSPQELKLDLILRHKTLFETVASIITTLVETRDKERELSKPNINIRVQLDTKYRLRGFTLIFRSSLLQNYRNTDHYMDMEYALIPMSRIKNDGNDNDSVEDNNESVYSGRESIFSGIKKREVFVRRQQKKSAFGPYATGKFDNKRNLEEESPVRYGIPPGISPIQNPNKLASPTFAEEEGIKGAKKLNKQSSRFMGEGSILSEGINSIQSSARAYKRNNARYVRSKVIKLSPLEDEEDSSSKYRKIRERVDNTIIVEYMPGEKDKASQISYSSHKQNSDILPELDGAKESADKIIKQLLEHKKSSSLS